MEKICIFTDSTSDLPREQAVRWNIDIVPIQIVADGKTYREFYDITPQDYWKLLMESKDIPQTSQIKMDDLMAQYRKAKEAGCTHCVGLIINGSGSGSYQTANIVRDMFYEENGRDMVIELIDSECYAYMYGSIAVACAQMREAGASFDAIVAEMRRRVKCVRAYLGVYSLRHLKKSGRISGGAAFVGEALGLRPVSLVCAGAVDVCAKVRGDKNVVPKLVELAARDAVNREQQTAYVVYAAVPEEQIALAEQQLLQAGFGAVERYPLGVAVTTNAGPQSIAVIFSGEQRD